MVRLLLLMVPLETRLLRGSNQSSLFTIQSSLFASIVRKYYFSLDKDSRLCYPNIELPQTV
jgi:hypothetical protein